MPLRLFFLPVACFDDLSWGGKLNYRAHCSSVHTYLSHISAFCRENWIVLCGASNDTGSVQNA